MCLGGVDLVVACLLNQVELEMLRGLQQSLLSAVAGRGLGPAVYLAASLGAAGSPVSSLPFLWVVFDWPGLQGQRGKARCISSPREKKGGSSISASISGLANGLCAMG